MNRLLTLAALLTGLVICTTHTVWAAIHSEVVNYQVAGQPFQGYLSYDDTIPGKRPGVLVVHEWWGNNAYARKRADMLAKLGYTAFALDMYGTGKLADHPDDARKFMQAALSDITVAETRFNTAWKWLQQQPTVNPGQIAAIGYCFGGGIVLHMAETGAHLAGVVSFHGSLGLKMPEKHAPITAKMLVLNGADDPLITAEQIATFKQDMQTARADYEFINYPGAKHGFTNPEADGFAKRFNMPLAYNATADKDSWQRMQKLLAQIFKP